MRTLLQEGCRPAVMRLYDPFDSLVALGGGNTPPEGTGTPVASEPAPARDELVPGELRKTPRSIGLQALLTRPALMNLATRLPPLWLLILVHEGEPAEVEAEARQSREICKRQRGVHVGSAPARRWLHKRWEISRNLPRIFESGCWTDTFETAIGWDGVARLHRAVRRSVGRHAFVMAHFSHAYADGCAIYFTFAGSASDPDRGLRQYDAAWAMALDAAQREGATFTHHHGVGLLKEPWFVRELGRGGMDAMRALKETCDPAGILNPGKLGLGRPGGRGWQ
jgi:alkyldihydroxyacetonephosphate synthase